MKRFYRLAQITTICAAANLPLQMIISWAKVPTEIGQWQARFMLGNQQFWLIASKAGMDEFSAMSRKDQTQLVEELLGKKKRPAVFYPPQQPVHRPAPAYPEAANRPAPVAASELPAKQPEEWTCVCGSKQNTKFCLSCGKPKPVPQVWTCTCGAENPETAGFCGNCGQKKPAPPVDELQQRIDAAIAAAVAKLTAAQKPTTTGNGGKK